MPTMMPATSVGRTAARSYDWSVGTALERSIVYETPLPRRRRGASRDLRGAQESAFGVEIGFDHRLDRASFDEAHGHRRGDPPPSRPEKRPGSPATTSSAHRTERLSVAIELALHSDANRAVPHPLVPELEEQSVPLRLGGEAGHLLAEERDEALEGIGDRGDFGADGQRGGLGEYTVQERQDQPVLRSEMEDDEAGADFALPRYIANGDRPQAPSNGEVISRVDDLLAAKGFGDFGARHGRELPALIERLFNVRSRDVERQFSARRGARTEKVTNCRTTRAEW